MAANISRLLQLGATALLTAPGLPPLLAAEPSRQGHAAVAVEQREQRQRFSGVWALVDNANNLFNVRLNADGSAVSTSGVDGVPLGGSSQMRSSQLYELGRWQPWGNGVRVDYRDGWSDAIVIGPGGPQQWSWAPGASRLEPPGNHGKAVQLSGAMAAAVGVYRIQPAQADLPVTTVSLMSNGLAFNAIDALAGGTWRLDNGEVVIRWSSGWVTRFEPRQKGPLQVRIWAPAQDHPSPPTAIRPGERLELAAP